MGRLDLSQATIKHPVTLTDCTFEEIVLTEASFPQLALIDCKVGKPGHWTGELRASHLSITGGDLRLEGFRGVVDLSGAHVRDDLHLEGAQLAKTDLSGAHVRDDLHLEGAQLAKTEGEYSLNAPNLRIGGNLCATTDEEHYSARPHDGRFSAEGKIVLTDARIDGSVYLNDAEIGRAGAESQYAVFGDGMVVGGSFIGSGIEAYGQVRLVGATVGGACEFHGALADVPKPGRRQGAFMLDRAAIGGSLFCDNGFICHGTFHAKGLRVTASAVFDGATITASKESDGAALQLDRALIGALLSLEEGLAAGVTATRAWRHRGEQQPDGPAAGQLRFWTEGAVTLTGAQVGLEVHLDVTGVNGAVTELVQLVSVETSSARVIADLTRLQTTILRLSGNHCAGRRAEPGSLIDLTQAKLVVLWDQEEVWRGADRLSTDRDEGLHYVLKGLRYEAVHASGVPFKRRLDWLAKSAHYARSAHRANREIASYTDDAPAPQPFDQLAAAYVAAGKDDDSRSIFLRKNQEIEHHRQTVPRPQDVNCRLKLKNWCVAFATRIWNITQNLFIGYGYRPSRALFSLLVLWAMGVAVFFLWPPDPYVRQTVVTEQAAELPRMNWVEHFTYPADLLIPLVGFGEKDRWHPATDGTTFLAAVLVIAGWFLGATVLVSVTRVVRRK